MDMDKFCVKCKEEEGSKVPGKYFIDGKWYCDIHKPPEALQEEKTYSSGEQPDESPNQQATNETYHTAKFDKVLSMPIPPINEEEEEEDDDQYNK